MFRCTNTDCAQAEEMTVVLPNGESAKLVTNQKMDELKLFIGETEITQDHPKFSEYQEQMESLDLEQEIKCTKCGETDTIEGLIDAFRNPMDVYETDNLCRCGGELWMDNVPGTSFYAWICDKCNWVKPNERISGGAE